jgi:Putative MetA-pathway of phenol degradation
MLISKKRLFLKRQGLMWEAYPPQPPALPWFRPPTGVCCRGFYHADIGGQVPFHGIVLNAGLKSALTALYVPERKVFGGNFGMSVSVPVGHVDLEAAIGRRARGQRLGPRRYRSPQQLGWQNGDLAYTIWLHAVTPTGRYDPGVSPILGSIALGLIPESHSRGATRSGARSSSTRRLAQLRKPGDRLQDW